MNSRAGKQYSCNPKAITEYLLSSGERYEIIWAFKNPAGFSFLEKEGIKVCKIRSLRYYYFHLTAKVIVTNEMGEGEIPKRKEQYKIDTWHGGGGGYKRIDYTGARSLRARLDLKDTDLFCASSETSLNNTVRLAFNHDGSYFPGTPRNDVFFKPISIITKKNICNYLKISEDCKLLLYAPTFRETHEDTFESTIDYDRLRDVLNEKFGGEWKILVRMHSAVKTYKFEEKPYLCDATRYPDMQDLLEVCDVLITDYSSSIWDFSFTNRPCFLYCYDLEEYINSRGFNKPIVEWGLPIAKNNSELCNAIRQFDSETHKLEMENQHRINGSFEDGNATRDMVAVIDAFCMGDKGFPNGLRIV